MFFSGKERDQTHLVNPLFSCEYCKEHLEPHAMLSLYSMVCVLHAFQARVSNVVESNH